MIKVFFILWYLLIGAIWLLLLAMTFSNAFATNFKDIRKQAIIEGLFPAFFITLIFLFIALLHNFIGAAIQWIVSLFH